jgi:hypothetical protein
MASLSACTHTAAAAAAARPATTRGRTTRRAAALRCSAAPSSSAGNSSSDGVVGEEGNQQFGAGVVVGRRALGVGAALLASYLEASSDTAAAFERPPPGTCEPSEHERTTRMLSMFC